MSQKSEPFSVDKIPLPGGIEFGEVRELISLIKDTYEGFKAFDEWSKQLSESVADWQYGIDKVSLFKKFSEEDQLAREKRRVDRDSSSTTDTLIHKIADDTIPALLDERRNAWAAQDTNAVEAINDKLTQTGKLLSYATEHLPKAKAAEEEARKTKEAEDKQLAYEQLQDIYEQKRINGLSANDQFHVLKGKEGALVQNLADSNPGFTPKTPDEAVELLRSYVDPTDIDKKNSILKTIIEWQELEARIKSITPSLHTDKSNAAHGRRTPQNTPQTNPAPELNNTVQALDRAAAQLQGMPDIKALQQQLNSTLTLVNKAISISEADNARSQKLEKEINALQKKVNMLQGHLKHLAR